MSEKCQRCGDDGDDRRTLWMACFYAMEELRIPFGQCQLIGTYHRKIGEHLISEDMPITVHDFDPNPAGEVPGETTKRQFFTLRVCKDCRADWMHAIQDWFQTKPERDTDEGGIYVRDFGTSRVARD